MATLKKKKKTSVHVDVEKNWNLNTFDGNVKWCGCYGKQYGGSSKKWKIVESYDQAIPVLSIHPKELKAGSQRDICIPVFIAALFTIAKRWKAVSKCLVTDKWINRMWIMEYYAVLKRKEILTHATVTQRSLEDIMLNEKSQWQMANPVWFHLYGVPRAVKFVETEKRMVVTSGWGDGGESEVRSLMQEV